MEAERHAPGGGLKGEHCVHCGFLWLGHPVYVRLEALGRFPVPGVKTA